MKSNMISRRGIIQSAGLVSAAAALGTMPAFAAPKGGGPRALALIFRHFAAPFLRPDWYVRLNMRYGNAIPEQYFPEVREDTRRMTANLV